eukprot:CAMPEP_0170469434 /NCGR_PEP_ID=MMETSP0123-20130129/12264_1 /TAXON_ID=182087 /ORGANISM="Favella ehrenbergii, Strain Fehren 1" /LENGTH=99 /DNA_ID=CAMNT_0010736299 /DNA_START=197 /DNA_END=493 /DNA_ORIENTATION=-
MIEFKTICLRQGLHVFERLLRLLRCILTDKVVGFGANANLATHVAPASTVDCDDFPWGDRRDRHWVPWSEHHSSHFARGAQKASLKSRLKQKSLHFQGK